LQSEGEKEIRRKKEAQRKRGRGREKDRESSDRNRWTVRYVVDGGRRDGEKEQRNTCRHEVKA
jgi:hypothetical protein